MIATLLVVMTLTAGAAQKAPDWSNPRALPSLITRWKSAVEPCAIAVHDARVFVLTKDRLLAHDADTGVPLWTQDAVAGECPYRLHEPLRMTGDVLVATLGERLFLVDPATGRVRQAVSLGGRISRLAGPPFVAEVIKSPSQYAPVYELLNVDATTGAIVARRPLKALLSDLDVFGEVAVVVDHRPRSKRSQTITYDVMGLALPGLEERWRTAGDFPQAERIGGAPHLMHSHWNGSWIINFYPLDPQTGRLGKPLPAPPSELEVMDVEGGGSRLRRNDAPRAQALWTAPLPCPFDAWARSGERLYVHCSGSGRGYLVVLDWATGALLDAAYGLPSVSQLATAGDVVILSGEDGVVGISGHVFGPPESTLVPAADEAHRILSRPMDARSLHDPWRDLQALGPEALHAIAAEVPTLAALPLRVAAAILGEARYTPAAPALAARLGGAYPHNEDPHETVLWALARTAGPAEVRAVAAILDDARQPGVVRRQALVTLANIGTAEAAAIIDAVVTKATSGRPWWNRRGSWNAVRKRARGEEREIKAAVLEQFFLFEGTRDPARFKVTIQAALPASGPATSDERAYQLDLDDRWSLAETYSVVVRRLGQRWVIRELTLSGRLER